MAKETLSMAQTRKILEEMGNIFSNCNDQLESKSEDFLKSLSKVWEDGNAVTFGTKFNSNIQGAADTLFKNTNTFMDQVLSIANAYIDVGGINIHVGKPSIIVKNINLSNILKEHFSDSENGDDFGFKNPETAPAEVTEIMGRLEEAINKISLETSDKMKHINAFGNDTVRLSLASSAGKVIGILKDTLASTKTALADAISETAKNYTSVGQAAAGTAGLGVDSAIEKIGGSDSFPGNQPVYGPAPGGGGKAEPNEIYGPTKIGVPKTNQVIYGPAPMGDFLERINDSLKDSND